MNSKVAKKFRTACGFHPNDQREYETITHRRTQYIIDGGKVIPVPYSTTQLVCKGSRRIYKRGKLFYKMIKQGRLTNASDLYNRGKENAARRSEGEQKNSVGDVSKKKIKPTSHRKPHEVASQTT